MLVVDTTAFIQPQPNEQPAQQEQKNEADESSVLQDDDDVEEQLPIQQHIDKNIAIAAEKKKKKLPPWSKANSCSTGKTRTVSEN